MTAAGSGWFLRTARRCTGAWRSFFGLTAARTGLTDWGGTGLPAAPFETAALHSPLASWRTTELCREWRATSTTLRRRLSPGELEQISQLRRHCLDELERRDQHSFDCWLADRDAADPTPFFRHPSRH